MDRRAFVVSALLAGGFIAVTAGAAAALPMVPASGDLAPADNIQTVWWRRRRGMASSVPAAVVLRGADAANHKSADRRDRTDI